LISYLRNQYNLCAFNIMEITMDDRRRNLISCLTIYPNNTYRVCYYISNHLAKIKLDKLDKQQIYDLKIFMAKAYNFDLSDNKHDKKYIHAAVMYNIKTPIYNFILDGLDFLPESIVSILEGVSIFL